jgi:aldehyde:ferredoxin oxidoreductase
MALKAVMHRMAFVDLSTGKVTVEEFGDEIYERFLGGYGIGAYMLLTRQRAKVDPLGPENTLGLLTGPLTGTNAPTSGRWAAVGKSPKTGTWGDANCGGRFGPAFKQSGFDGIFFTGVSEKPVYALVEGAQVRLLDAGELWGLDCTDALEEWKRLHGKECWAAYIGPAGERVSLLACIIDDRGRAAGRSGLGTVMGSKRLKGVVAKPGMEIELADPERFKEVRRKYIERFFNDKNPMYALFHNYGTCGITAGSGASGDMPMKNWMGIPADFPTADKISDDNVVRYQVRRYACAQCPVGCGGEMKIEEGPYAVEGHKPEYETIGSFGGMCLNDNIESITKCNDICNRAGMDTISTGTTVAFAIECYERGLITKEDTDGLELTWGNHEAIVKVTEQMARGEGFGGRVLGDGMKAAAARIGKDSEKYAMHIQGEELPMHDPRCSPGLGASYIADATPARHTQTGSWFDEANFVGPGLGHKHIEDKYQYSGKGPTARRVGNWNHCINILGVCEFGWVITPAPAMAEFLNAAMGLNWDLEDVLLRGERAANLRVAFNVREGLLNVGFRIPPRVVGIPPLPGGPLEGVTVDYMTEIREFYEAMGWHPETGIPLKETLLQLGLPEAAAALYGA